MSYQNKFDKEMEKGEKEIATAKRVGFTYKTRWSFVKNGKVGYSVDDHYTKDYKEPVATCTKDATGRGRIAWNLILAESVGLRIDKDVERLHIRNAEFSALSD
jgi:hypothetical protein